MLLYEKYTPKTLNGLIGNRLPIEKLKQFSIDIQSHKKPKPVMVYGPSGTGKTTAIRAIAFANGFELVELTASDYRDAETLRKKLLPAVASRGLFSAVTLVLFDEIDELSSSSDKGAESVITQIIKTSKQPIVFTANDYWDQRISFLRSHVERVEFKKVESREMIEYLKKIAKQEGKELSDETTKEIAYRSDGDVRGALNDLQMVLLGGSDVMESLGVRNRKLEIFRVLDKIFTTNNFSAARAAVENSDTDMSMMMNWVEENIPARYWLKQSLDSSYADLAFASRFFEMAERFRYYGYMKYASAGIAGISLSSGGSTRYLSPYSFPSKIRHLSSTKASRGEQGKIAAKLSPFLHTNKHEIVSSYLPLFKTMFSVSSGTRIEEMKDAFENNFRLEKEEIAFFASSS